MAEQAARLAKADLVTGMVGEFPELQGVMGGYYARAEGYPDAVADAIRDHYKPVGQGDDVPTAPVTVAVSLADKLDTLVSFFAADMAPTGSKDPYALRRAAIAIISMLIGSALRIDASEAIKTAYQSLIWQRQLYLIAEQPGYGVQLRPVRYLKELLAARSVEATFHNTGHYGYIADGETLLAAYGQDGIALTGFVDVADAIELTKLFLVDRLKVQQREAGVRHDLIDAVFALGGEDDLVRLLARVKALQAFVETGEGANLLAGYRRAANILRAEAKKGEGIAPARHPGEGRGPELPASAPEAPDAGLRPRDEEGNGRFTFPYDRDPAELALADALDRQLPLAEQAIAAEDFAAAMTALSVLRPAIDCFFDEVTVNADEPAKRTARLALLAKLVAAMHKVADFSKIEG